MTADLPTLQAEADRLTAQIDALGREADLIRDKKRALAARRREVLSEVELQTKLRTLTPEHRGRVTLNPLPAVAKATARK